MNKGILIFVAAVVIFLLVKKFSKKKEDEPIPDNSSGGGGGGGGNSPTIGPAQVINPALGIVTTPIVEMPQAPRVINRQQLQALGLSPFRSGGNIRQRIR